MADINIPGVSDRYKTNDLVQSLMKVERIPLDRATDSLDTYKAEKTIWQNVGKKMTTLRDSSRTLFSYNNPFNEKTAKSSNEDVLTATVTRDAVFETSKVEVLEIATPDKFISKELEKNYTIPKGSYIYTSGEKKMTLNWGGGSIGDFALAVNRRNSVVRASVINVSKNTQALVFESLQTGKENSLSFEGDALSLALDVGIVEKAIDQPIRLASSAQDVKPVNGIISSAVRAQDGALTVPPQNGIQIPIPQAVKENDRSLIEFSISMEALSDGALSKQSDTTNPILNSSGHINFKGIIIENAPPESGLSYIPPPEIQEAVKNDSVLYIRTKDGTETALESLSEGQTKTISFSPADYEAIDSIVIRNTNTARTINLSQAIAYDPSSGNGYQAINPVSHAGDALIKYEGITLSRSTNEIKDIIPGVTLNVHEKSTKPVTLTIEPNTEIAKEAIITMVGNYNQLMAELNILTQNKPEVIDEIVYFTEDEAESAQKRLGKFQGDFTLTNQKSTMQRIMSNPYPTIDGADITLLAQIGVSTKANSAAGTYSPNQTRGYLEIDEKKLDEALKSNMSLVKNIFGYDSDGDLIIDTGIGYALDKNLQAYVQLGGLIATRTSGLDSKITSTQTSIKRLETQLQAKESELKRKYGSMEGTLNNLESQSSTISNFNNQQQK